MKIFTSSGSDSSNRSRRFAFHCWITERSASRSAIRFSFAVIFIQADSVHARVANIEWETKAENKNVKKEDKNKLVKLLRKKEKNEMCCAERVNGERGLLTRKTSGVAW